MKRKAVVVDSSVMVKWVNSQNEDLLNQAGQILKDTERGKIELLAPELAKYEIGNALLYKDMPLSATKQSLGTIYSIPIDFYPLDQRSAANTLEIAKENKITFYDACFIQLAKERNAILVTANPKHHQQYKNKKVTNLNDYR